MLSLSIHMHSVDIDVRIMVLYVLSYFNEVPINIHRVYPSLYCREFLLVAFHFNMHYAFTELINANYISSQCLSRFAFA